MTIYTSNTYLRIKCVRCTAILDILTRIFREKRHTFEEVNMTLKVSSPLACPDERTESF